MPLVFAILGAFGLLAVVLVGLVWAAVVAAPFYILIGTTIFLIYRSRRRRRDYKIASEIENERRKADRAREHDAWKSAADVGKSKRL